MERAAAAGEEKLSAENWIYDMSGDFSAYYGHLGQARKAWRRAVEMAEGTGHPDQAAQHRGGHRGPRISAWQFSRGSPGQ